MGLIEQGASASEIRRAFEAKGITVPGRGKLPWWVIKQWNAANPDRPYRTGQGYAGWGAKEQNIFDSAQHQAREEMQ